MEDIYKIAAQEILNQVVQSLSPDEKETPFSTGYERTPGQEIQVKDTRSYVGPRNNKTANYNKTQAERMIIKSLSEGINPFETLSTGLSEGTWASRLPYKETATGDIGTGVQRGTPNYFDYMPMLYHDFYSPIQNYIGDQKTEKLLEARGMQIPWKEGEARIPPNFSYGEDIAMTRLAEARQKYPESRQNRLAYYQSGNLNKDLGKRREDIARMLENNPEISNLVEMYKRR